VGACVGMRGSRVKDIVGELQGEKIDIIRWSDDLREYITASLSPAKITEIRLDKRAQRAQVIVADDQLSLAIGKHGQNVRLASKLSGWDLDIRTREEIVKEKEETKKVRAIMHLEGVGEKILDALFEAGFSTLERLANATMEQLSEVKGIGEKKAEKILAAAKDKWDRVKSGEVSLETVMPSSGANDAPEEGAVAPREKGEDESS
jgi:N utilization substance protein A